MSFDVKSVFNEKVSEIHKGGIEKQRQSLDVSVDDVLKADSFLLNLLGEEKLREIKQ